MASNEAIHEVAVAVGALASAQRQSNVIALADLLAQRGEYRVRDLVPRAERIMEEER